MQGFILTYLNEDKRNVLHLACYFGNYEMVKFIVEKANLLGIIDFIIHALDEMQLPPIYLLCQRGYKKEFQDVIQKTDGNTDRKKMIELLIPAGKFKDSCSARWDDTAR